MAHVHSVHVHAAQTGVTQGSQSQKASFYFLSISIPTRTHSQHTSTCTRYKIIPSCTVQGEAL